MEAEDILVGCLYALPWFAIAGIFYAIAMWKKSKGRRLHTQALSLLASGNDKDARDIFLQALWRANEEPSMERRILADLGRLYEKTGVNFRAGDYEVLIRQFEQLSRKGSQKAIADL